MYRLLTALAAAATLLAVPAAASDRTDIMAVLHQWADGFNKGDFKSALATCAKQTSILGDVPPYEWHGPGACSRWLKVVLASDKSGDVSDAIATLSEPRHFDVTGDHAYVVVSTDLTFKQKGTQMKQNGATVTFALKRTGSHWRIIGWAWAPPK